MDLHVVYTIINTYKCNIGHDLNLGLVTKIKTRKKGNEPKIN
jgi:hypothetical protein